ncbi:MAG: hypothetical protein U5J64_06050 [Halobacteriales archaeon]|nr:hypothetical protein [Halobacteriales archaeon]
MADDKKSRDKQARDEERRQMKRDQDEARERMGEPEPPIEDEELDEIETELGSLEFPATGAEVVDVVGERVVESVARRYSVEELVPDTEAERFGSPSVVLSRIKRPTVARAMKRIAEAVDTLPDAELEGSQRETYEKTLRELKEIDADDEDEGIRVVADWIVERIHEKEKLPGSRSVRRRAAEFCRANGYEVRNNDWLGV